jgi:hypothetical protein
MLISFCISHFISRRAKSNTPEAKTPLWKNPPHRGNPRLKHTWMDKILKKFYLKKNFKLKNKCSAGSYKLQIYPLTPSAANPNPVGLSL